MKRALAIIGSYPPPYGGVAVHCRRLKGLLDEREVPYTVYNAVTPSSAPNVVSVVEDRETWLIRYLLTGEESVIYLLSDRPWVWLAAVLLGSLRGRRVVVRLRNSTLPDLVEASPRRALLAKFALQRMSGVVCVSEFLADTARSLGVPEERILHSPGFLPPTLADMDRDGVDSSVWRFAEDRHPVLSANGKVNWYQGQDLYGLDLLVDLVARLAEDFPTIGLVICFFDHFERDQSYVDSLVERARELGVERNILFNTARSVLLPVIDASDLFVRPTATDGDANSIREALYVGTPVVASDCVVRPAGVACFRNRDIDDLEATVRRVLGAGHSDNSEMATEVRDGAQIRASTYLDFLTNILD